MKNAGESFAILESEIDFVAGIANQCESFCTLINNHENKILESSQMIKGWIKMVELSIEISLLELSNLAELIAVKYNEHLKYARNLLDGINTKILHAENICRGSLDAKKYNELSDIFSQINELDCDMLRDSICELKTVFDE